FGLVVERREQAIPADIFTVAKAGVIKAHEPTGPPDCKRALEDGTLTCRNITIEAFVAQVVGTAPGYFDLPGVDRTSLSGAFDFSFRYVARANVGPENPSLSLYNALEKATGIHVE